MDEIVNLYVRWNRAFHDYFFANNDDEEIFLYVNEEVIDRIGASNNLGNHNEFLRVVLLRPNDRSCFYGTLRQRYIGYGPYARTSRSLFEFACNLIDNDIRKKIPCAYLNFIILAIYIASIAQNGHRPNLGSYLSDYLRNNIGDNGNRNNLESLFKALHGEHPEFRNYRLNEQRYVGLLKYQLVLSKAEIDGLEQALYRNGFVFSEDDSYQEIVYRIRDYVDANIRERLDESLVSEPHRKRFEDIIMNFDIEKYAASHNTEPSTRRSIGYFAHALYFGDGGDGKLILLTDVKDLSLNRNGFKIFEDPFNSLNGYNPKHVLINDSDQVSLTDISLDNDRCRITTLPNAGVYFFKRCNDAYYIETHLLTNQETFVVVRNDRNTLMQWENFCNQNNNCPISSIEDSAIVERIFGRGWIVFNAENGFNQQFYNDFVQVAQRRIYVNTSHIQMKSGIKQVDKKNVYLPNALPYFEFPVNVDSSYLTVAMNIDGLLQEENSSYALYIQENKLIIDIIDANISMDVSYDVDIYIKYESPDFSEDVNKSFSICGQEIAYNNNELFKYDIWGQYKVSLEDDEVHISGNKVLGCQEQRIAGISNNLNNLRPIGEEDMQNFYFINLLSAILFNRRNEPITNNVLKKCIRYSSTRRDINFFENENFVSTLRNLLVNSGYLCPDYQNGNTKYQAMPPTFLRIPPRVNLGNGRNTTHNGMFMLGGCYTRKFLADLCEYCKCNEISLFVKEKNANNATSAYSLLPPILLLEDSFDVNDFIEVTGNNCEYTSNDLALALMEIQPGFTAFEETLEGIEDTTFNADIQPTVDENYPRVRTSITGGYQTRKWIELSANKFASTDIRDFSWMDLYCRYKLQKPTLLYNGTGEICVPNNVHFPYLIQRAMFLMNVGQPQYRKVFISNNSLTSDDLYSTLKIYNIGTGERRLDIILSLLTNRTDYTNNPMLCPSKTVLNMEMELWTCKAKFKENPIFMTLKRTATSDYIAFSTKKKVFVNRNGSFYEVLGTPNRVLTILLENERRYRTWEQMGITFTNNILECPNPELYNIEPLEIK